LVNTGRLMYAEHPRFEGEWLARRELLK